MTILEALYTSTGLRLNPFTSISLALGLAYAPIGVRSYYLAQKLAKEDKPMSWANMRAQATAAMDETPDGVDIAVANNCHVNGLEAFGYFSVAVLSACVTHVNNSVIEGLCASFILVRSAYTVVYLCPQLNGPLRSGCWALGLGLCLDLLCKAGCAWKATRIESR
jgi:uncharacterized MAPEG superfamily protein